MAVKNVHFYQDLVSYHHLRNCVLISLEALPSLRVLKVIGCGHGVLSSLVHVASSVTKLEISLIKGLSDEMWRGVIKNLVKVEEIRMIDCDEIRYLWESEAEAGKVLVNLRELEVRNCSNLVSLGEKEEDYGGSNLTSLRTLRVFNCKSLEHCSCPDSIESLTNWGCDSITSVSFPTGGGQKLKSVTIRDCKKLLEKELGIEEKTRVLIKSSMQMLQSIDIESWQNLKSITELKCPNLKKKSSIRGSYWDLVSLIPINEQKEKFCCLGILLNL
ncbi:hypothetical protein L2E82_45234 [Cichorium intybus]|uniref:Uncharacterized protein n=1 Tax=Cichorium intybus TaxID=13427 RepID=A0ACB8ZSN8_CICIN|nr:hypothetical protein L2E82_45234 [Cichorium intybus]